MNFDELQNQWSQQTVSGRPIEAQRLRSSLADEIRQRSQSIRRLIRFGLFIAAVGWSVTLVAHFTGIKPLNTVTLTTFLGATLLDFVCLRLAFQALRQMQSDAVNMGETLADSLRISLRSIEAQMRNCRHLAYGLLIAFAVALATNVIHYDTGNTPLRGFVASLTLTFCFSVAIGLTLRRYYQEKLRPRRAELAGMVADLTS